MLRNSLARCNARHLRIKRLVQFIFADPVYNNALKNRAALLCRAQRRFSGLCSRTVSGTANRLRKIRKKKSSAVPPVSQRSHVGNLRQTIQGKGVIHKRVETAGVYPLVRPRGVSAGVYPLVPLPGRQDFLTSQATLCRSAPERKRGTLLPRSVPLCAYYWFLFS